MPVIRYINNSDEDITVGDITVNALDQVISRTFIKELDKLAGTKLLILVDGSELTPDMVPGLVVKELKTKVETKEKE